MVSRGSAGVLHQVFNQSPVPSPQSPLLEDFWALKDVSFEVKQGDRIGIIGRNGAGKSTLLKILSRITEPTTGSVRIKGRVASLLEVGTGFHPELTGRENIFLNGAILGMGRAEIKKKFDEIVDFAEIEKFLDTPVKRYSSGMYVRLAFAVAAHLEPEILIVDEVLAVGDAQFQKKCLGKMEEVGREGRTVLFVSHNSSVLRQLCNKGLLLCNGIVAMSGTMEKVMNEYFATSLVTSSDLIDNSHFQGTLAKYIHIESIMINQEYGKNYNVSPCDEIHIKIVGSCSYKTKIRISFVIYSSGTRICTLHDTFMPEPLCEGKFVSEIIIPPYVFRPGMYHVAVGGDNGGATFNCTEWFGNEIGAFCVLDEWNEFNDLSKVGILNISHQGCRRSIQ